MSIKICQPSNSRTTASDVVEEIRMCICVYLDFAKCKWNSILKEEQKHAVWQLGFCRNILALFPTGHLARVSQAFWRASSYSLCFGRLSSTS